MLCSNFILIFHLVIDAKLDQQTNAQGGKPAQDSHHTPSSLQPRYVAAVFYEDRIIDFNTPQLKMRTIFTSP